MTYFLYLLFTNTTCCSPLTKLSSILAQARVNQQFIRCSLLVYFIVVCDMMLFLHFWPICHIIARLSLTMAEVLEAHSDKVDTVCQSKPDKLICDGILFVLWNKMDLIVHDSLVKIYHFLLILNDQGTATYKYCTSGISLSASCVM